MLLTIGLIIGAFIFGYLVGANNPLDSVKKKIALNASNVLKKIS